MKKALKLISGIALALIVLLIPIQGLSFAARAALAILCMAIVWWVLKVLPDFVTAMIMAALFVYVCGVPTEKVFYAFSGSTWWLLMTAFALSLGVSKCGLLKRISLGMLKLFPKSFSGQVFGLTAVGLVSAPFIPSMSAKSAIMAPISLGINDAMGYERKSKQAAGLFSAMLMGLRSPGPLLISASPLGYAFRAYYSDEINSIFTMSGWFIAALPWFIITTLLSVLMLLLLFRPKNEGKVQSEIHADTLPPMGRKEKTMAAIISVTLILWVTEELHGCPPHIVAAAAVCIMLATNVLNVQEFRAEMNWDSVIFIGLALGIAQVFAHVSINDWIMEISSPVLSFCASKPAFFLLCVALATVLLRFIIVSEIAYLNIVMVFLVPISIGAGINPWVVGLTVYALISPWFFLYQNPVYMAAHYATRGEMVDSRQLVLPCLLYLVICTVAILLSIPYWMGRAIFFLPL